MFSVQPLAVSGYPVTESAATVVLLKDLSDRRVRSSAAATISHADKIVESQNPVTVIVKIEGHDLNQRPAYGCCPKQ